MNTDAVADLVAEIREYLAAGGVGLYEFIWVLRSDHPEVPEADLKAHAVAALDELLRDGSARLVWNKWADANFEREADRHQVDDSAWEAPTDRPFVALRPTG